MALASAVLACAVLGGTGGTLAGLFYGAKTERQRLRVQFSHDLVDDMTHLRREWSAFQEDAEGVLESVERKRAQAAGRRGRQERGQEGQDPWGQGGAEPSREAILARAGQLGLVRSDAS